MTELAADRPDGVLAAGSPLAEGGGAADDGAVAGEDGAASAEFISHASFSGEDGAEEEQPDAEMDRKRTPQEGRILSRRRQRWPAKGDQGGGGGPFPVVPMVAGAFFLSYSLTGPPPNIYSLSKKRNFSTKIYVNPFSSSYVP